MTVVTLLLILFYLFPIPFFSHFNLRQMCFKKKCFLLNLFSFFFHCQHRYKKSLSFSLAVLPSLNTPLIPWPFIGPTYSLASFLFPLSEERFIISFNTFYFSSSVYFALSLLCFCTCCNLPFLLLFAFFLLRNSLNLLFIHVGFLFTFFKSFLIDILCFASYLVYVRETAWFARPK